MDGFAIDHFPKSIESSNFKQSILFSQVLYNDSIYL